VVVADHVIAATGYEMDLSRMSLLSEPLLRFVVGAGFSAPVLPNIWTRTLARLGGMAPIRPSAGGDTLPTAAAGAR
jgi:hypothetical protein